MIGCAHQFTRQRTSHQDLPMATLSPKLWLYTNFDCNLRCSYCVAESSPSAPSRRLTLSTVRRLVDEAVDLGFQRIFFTGGEPFVLARIYDMLAYASQRLSTTVLTNAVLLRGGRLDKLAAVDQESLSVQVSLDGARPEHHDPYRGRGSWRKTVEGIQRLQSRGFHVTISTTRTAANRGHLDELAAYRRSLGIPDGDHFVRPLVKRGFSQEGMAVGTDTLVPELAVTKLGVYWHPLVSPSDTDMLVTEHIFPLEEAARAIVRRIHDAGEGCGDARIQFT